MDIARQLVKRKVSNDTFGVVAKRQTKGRGTNSRNWLHGYGNLFMTIVINRTKLPIQLHYLPLRSAILVCSVLDSLVVNSMSCLKLKWPNDILIDGKKVCGILIEMEDDCMLIGIGCNIATVPDVSMLGQEALREATAVVKHSAFAENISTTQQISVGQNVVDELYKDVAISLMNSFKLYTETSIDNSAEVIREFSSRMDYSPQRMRNSVDLGLHIIPHSINSDGTLKVRDLHNNSETTLIADYLW